ncbi:MAG: hypothetical protein FJ086_13215 [Deltaproteobacteria bacterium]|nr:hypothetical protein [Deltaproteobacteria bacterium]
MRLPVPAVAALGCLLLCCGPSPTPVAQDATFLVPLAQARTFLPGREVLPRALFDRGHPLTVTDEPTDLYEALGTVGVRLDPCFHEGSDTTCHPQLRLVLQPVFDEGSGQTSLDAAVHLFFRGSSEEVLAAVQSIGVARVERGVAADFLPTVPHPGFGDGAFRTRLKSALRPFLAMERLVRVSQMGVHASHEAWMFSGMDLTSGSPMDLPVPTLAPEHEQHVTSTGALTSLEITLNPRPVAEPAIIPVIAQGGIAGSSPGALADAAEAIRRIEDPAAHNPGTIDCASCHVAPASRFQLQRAGTAVTSGAELPRVYEDTRNLRAFGYYFTEPAVSPRLLQEAEAVLDILREEAGR